jgi:hypothetical protein
VCSDFRLPSSHGPPLDIGHEIARDRYRITPAESSNETSYVSREEIRVRGGEMEFPLADCTTS